MENLKHCFMTKRGTLPLFRRFGLAGVDDNAPPLQREIINQIAEYYPQYEALSVNLASNRDELAKGKFYYNINISGGDYGIY